MKFFYTVVLVGFGLLSTGNGHSQVSKIDKTGAFLEEYVTLNFNGLWLSSDLTSPYYGPEYFSMQDLFFGMEDGLSSLTRSRIGPIGCRLSVTDMDARFSIGMDVNYSQISEKYVHRSIEGGNPQTPSYQMQFGEGLQTTYLIQGKIQSLIFGSMDLLSENRALSLQIGFGAGSVAWTNERFKSESPSLNGRVNKVTSERFSPSAFLFLKGRWMITKRLGFVGTIGIGNSILSVGATQRISDIVL